MISCIVSNSHPSVIFFPTNVISAMSFLNSNNSGLKIGSFSDTGRAMVWMLKGKQDEDLSQFPKNTSQQKYFCQ